MRDCVAAVIQLNCGDDQAANLAAAEALVEQAASRGADLVATPENTPYLGTPEAKAQRAEPLDGAVCARFAALARRLGIHLLLGSFAERGSGPGRCRNTSVLFGPDGAALAVYRKLHLFDVDLPGVRFTESETVEPGTETVVAATPPGALGLSICYDLRFPELYRRLRRDGAELLAVPSAFTHPTGRDHWEVLLRARAIENQCFVLAPAQVGQHDDGGIRRSWGHAMIVDPWGEVLADAGEAPGVALAPLRARRLEQVRAAIPMQPATPG